MAVPNISKASHAAARVPPQLENWSHFNSILSLLSFYTFLLLLLLLLQQTQKAQAGSEPVVQLICDADQGLQINMKPISLQPRQMLEKRHEMQQERRLRLVYWLDGLIRRQELNRAQDSKQISGRFWARRESGKYAAFAGKKTTLGSAA